MSDTSLRRARTLLGVTVAVALLGLAAARPTLAAMCTIDPVPGATLLYPIFELDLDAPTTHDTVISVQNVGDSAIIAHVTFWTDWAVPIMDFDVYLARFDVQTIDMKDVIVDGRLPATGSAVSPHGPLSGSPVAFPGCNNTTTPGNGPVYQDPALTVTMRTHLQASLTGKFSPTLGGCGGSNRGNNLARGYITIDANDACTLLFPTSAAYFSGPASRRNVLAGDLAILRPGALHAVSFPAVAIEAAPEGQSVPGGQTFYGRYLGGSGEDGREPLPTVFEARYLDGGVFDGGTDFYVWRETPGSPPGVVACGNSPSWAPLSTEPVAFFDEQEHVTDVNQPFPIALNVQPTAGLSPYVFGQAFLDLRQLVARPPVAGISQAWVGMLTEATGRFAASNPATSFPPSCTP